MYERFTQCARRIMQLANQEALTLKNVRLEIEKLIRSGPEMITMGKLPQTPRTKKTLEYAIEISRDLEHEHVGSEHILLGLLNVKEGVHADVLNQLGVNLEWAYTEVINQISLGHTDDDPDDSSTEQQTEKTKNKKSQKKRLREKRRKKLSKTKLEDTKHLVKWTYSYTEKHSYFKKKNVATFLDEETLFEIALTLSRKRKNNVLLIGNQSLALEYMDSLGFMSHQGQLPNPLLDHDFREVLYASTAFETEMEKQSRLLYSCHEARLVGNTSLIIKNYETISQIKSEDKLQTFGQALEGWIKSTEVRIIALVPSLPGSDFHDSDGNYFTPIIMPELSDAKVKRRLDHRETDQTTVDLETEMRETFRAYHSLLNWGKFEKSANHLAHFNDLKIARLKIGALPVVWPEDLGNAT